MFQIKTEHTGHSFRVFLWTRKRAVLLCGIQVARGDLKCFAEHH